MGLIRKHKPRSHEELYLLIKNHYENKCDCGIQSQGTIEDFGKNLYNAQQKFWNKNKYSLNECIKWEYDLFIVQSLKGQCMEEKVKQILQKKLKQNYSIKDANEYIDDTLRIDLEVYKKNQSVCGIQVKPISFKKTRKQIRDFNKKSNELYGLSVFYVYYDYKTEKILNLDKTVDKILTI